MTTGRSLSTRVRYFFFLAAFISCGSVLSFFSSETVFGDATTNPSSGQLIRVPIPITGNVERRLIAQLRSVVERLQSDQTAQNREQVIVLEFDASRSGDGGGSEFEDCLKLVRFLTSPSLKGIKTVAFLPQPLKGHALLVVMACDQVMMSTESSMTGLNSIQGANDPTIRSSYLQIAGRRKTFPEKIS